MQNWKQLEEMSPTIFASQSKSWNPGSSATLNGLSIPLWNFLLACAYAVLFQHANSFYIRPEHELSSTIWRLMSHTNTACGFPVCQLALTRPLPPQTAPRCHSLSFALSSIAWLKLFGLNTTELGKVQNLWGSKNRKACRLSKGPRKARALSAGLE